MKKILFTFLSVATLTLSAQTHEHLYAISESISAERIKSDIKTLTEFGTRHTLSDTISKNEVSEPPVDGSRLNLKRFQKIAETA